MKSILSDRSKSELDSKRFQNNKQRTTTSLKLLPPIQEEDSYQDLYAQTPIQFQQKLRTIDSKSSSISRVQLPVRPVHPQLRLLSQQSSLQQKLTEQEHKRQEMLSMQMKSSVKNLELEAENSRLKKIFKDVILKGASGILKDEYELLENKYKKVTEQLKQLRKEYQTVQETSLQLKNQLETDRNNLQNVLDAEKEEVNLTVKKLKQTIDTLKSENATITAQATESQVQIDKLTWQLASKKALENELDELRQIKTLYQNCKLEIHQSREKIIQIQSKFQEINIDREVCLKRAIIAEQELLETNRSIMNSQIQIAKLEQSCKELKFDKHMLKEEYDAMLEEYQRPLPPILTRTVLSIKNQSELGNRNSLLDEPIFKMRN